MLAVNSKDVLVTGKHEEPERRGLSVSDTDLLDGDAVSYFNRKPFWFSTVNASDDRVKKTLLLVNQVRCNRLFSFRSEDSLNPGF